MFEKHGVFRHYRAKPKINIILSCNFEITTETVVFNTRMQGWTESSDHRLPSSSKISTLRPYVEKNI